MTGMSLNSLLPYDRENKTMLRLNSRYLKMDVPERARYRKEVKFYLVALSCIYLGFSAWWVLMSPVSA